MVLPDELPKNIIISYYQNLPFLTASLYIIDCVENMNSGLPMSLLIFVYGEWAKITCAFALTEWRLQCMS